MTAATTSPVIEQKIAVATGGTDADRDRLRQLTPAGTIPCRIVFDLSNDWSWTNASQVELILEEMTADHRANVADMLEGLVADQDGWNAYVAEAALRLLLDKVPLSDIVVKAEALAAVTTVEDLRQTPLMRRIEKLATS